LEHFTAHRLRFVAQVQSTVELNEHQGSAIRGALFHALRNRFCGLSRGGARDGQDIAECATCPLVATCPVATLVGTLRPESGRGRDVPRPYTIQVANQRISESANRRGAEGGQESVRYEPEAQFEFGLTLYAQALQLFPYVVLAVGEFEQGGIGRRVRRPDGHWRRGTLAIQEVWADNPHRHR